jgi:hypothetical protein
MPFLQPDHKPIIRHPSGKEVEVIASFKPNGDFIPMYFRVEDDREERFTFKIDAIQSIKDKHGVKVFECVYKAYGQRNVILLAFDVCLHRWVIE